MFDRSFTRLGFQLLVLLALYALCRGLFGMLNYQSFSLTLPATGMILLSGLRFDISAIALTNAILVILTLLPLPFRTNPAYERAIGWLYVLPNSFFLLLNIIDIAYFPFVHKRMQADAFLFLTGAKGTDFYQLLPIFIVRYWYLWLLYAALAFGLWKAYQFSRKISASAPHDLKSYLQASAVFLFTIALSVLGARGGLQLKPLSIIHASEMVEAQHIPLVLNTPFSIINTLDKKGLPEVHYVEEQQLSDCDKGFHTFPDSNRCNRQNVVIIMVESLSQSYISYFKGAGKTPFLDSLFAQSLVFPNGFANAKESVQGIPAVLASIPSCQDEPFTFSNYSGNRISALANLLKPEGYSSSFFHGGSTGTMGFNSFCKLAGFDHYYGREDYNDDRDFDGDWGIWDEPFLQFTARKLDETPKPFVAAIFTLNTHHPFAVPAKYKDRFTSDGHPILACLQYTDYALARFFETVRQTDWYQNTLFVITADHTGPHISDKGNSLLDDYRIPIVFFKPDGSLKGQNDRIASQIDIMPTVLHLLEYPGRPFFSLGQDLFEQRCQNFSINYRSGIYQYIDSLYCFQFNGQKGTGLFQWKTDPELSRNILENAPLETARFYEDRTKRFIQVFNNSMIRNAMH